MFWATRDEGTVDVVRNVCSSVVPSLRKRVVRCVITWLEKVVLV